MNGLCDGPERWLVMRLSRKFILGNGYDGVRRALLGVISDGALMVFVLSVDRVPLGRDSSDGAGWVSIRCCTGFSVDCFTMVVLSREIEEVAACCFF